MPKKLKHATKTKTYGTRPSYLDETPAPDDPEFWQRIEWSFTFALENLIKRFVQTEEEAAGSFVPAETTGGSKNDWVSAPLDPRAFPHVSGLDEDDLSALLEIVETHYDEVCKGIQERRLSSEFLWRWGAIGWAIGGLEAYSRLEPKPDGHKRAAMSRNRSDKENRESWYARQIIRIQIIARRKRKKGYAPDGRGPGVCKTCTWHCIRKV